MARTLKSSGSEVQDLVLALCVDDDDATIVEFVDSDVNANKTVHANVTVGTTTWNGTTLPYFQTGGSGVNPEHILFASGFRPAFDMSASGAGITFLIVLDTLTSSSSFAGLLRAESSNWWFELNGSDQGEYGSLGSSGPVGTTSVPRAGAGFAIGGFFKNSDADSSIVYGAEGGTMAIEATSDPGNFGSAVTGISELLGYSGFGHINARCIGVFAWNGNKSLADLQAVLDNPMTALFQASGPSISLGGTLSDDGTEAEVRAPSQSLVLTVANDTLVATVGDDNAITTALINGLDSAQAEATGWDAIVKAGLNHGHVTRDSDTQLTIALPGFISYNISATETITVTVPASALVTSSTDVVASTTFDITPSGISVVGSGTIVSGTQESDVASGGQALILTPAESTWVATVGDDNAITDALIAGLDSAQAEATGWDAVVKAGLTHANVTRDSDTQVTITLPAFGSYNITAQETITVTVPASALVGAGSPVVATPTFQIDITPPGITISDAFKNNTGTVQASETGITLDIYLASTGAFVVRKTNIATDGSGLLPTINDAALVGGTAYRVVGHKTGRFPFVIEVTAA